MFYKILLCLMITHFVIAIRRPRDCLDLFNAGKRVDKEYTIYTNFNTSLNVRCDMTNGGWTIIARKINESIFSKGWKEYKNGFGNVNNSYWIGLDNMHVLTWRNKNCLRIDLSKTNSYADEYLAVYDYFQISSEEENYKLSLGNKMYGDLLEGLLNDNGFPFSTYDNDHDTWPSNCASHFNGGWWMGACYSACLTCVNNEAGNWQRNGKWYYFNYFEMKVKISGDC